MASPYYNPYEDPNYVQQQANNLGITADQYSQLAAQDVGQISGPTMAGPTTYNQGNNSVNYGVRSGSALDTLSQLKAAGINLGGGQQQQPNQPPGLINPTLAMQHPYSILGAQAEQAVGLNPTGTVAINPTPTSGTPNAKSGTSPVGTTQYYNLKGQPVPGQVSALGQGAQAVYQPAYTPTQATTAPLAATPQAFAVGAPSAAGVPPPPGGGGGAPFAQAPPAPNVSVPPAPTAPAPMDLFSAHASALADAGKAIYAHYGGDPGSATPADIAGFHSELQGALAGGPPIKRRSGGPVPGMGNTDTVPAMLTPGEFVMNKDAVSRIGEGRLAQMNQPQHFQGGGSVDNEPPEARRKTIAAGSSQPPAAPGDSQPSSVQPPPQQPADPGSSGTSAGPAWQNYRAQLEAMNQKAGYLPYNAATMPGVPSYGLGQNPNAGLPAGTSGYVTESGQAIGPTPGTAGAMSPAGASALSSGISGLASGLSAAAQTYANSVKPWTPQPSAIGKFGSPVAQSGPAATFSQPQAQGPQQQYASNEYNRLRMMGLV